MIVPRTGDTVAPGKLRDFRLGARAQLLDAGGARAPPPSRPRPTAPATRFTEPCRTSPAANTPGMLVSSASGSRSSGQPSGRVPSSSRSGPVRMKPASSVPDARSPRAQPVRGVPPMQRNSAEPACVSARRRRRCDGHRAPAGRPRVQPASPAVAAARRSAGAPRCARRDRRTSTCRARRRARPSSRARPRSRDSSPPGRPSCRRRRRHVVAAALHRLAPAGAVVDAAAEQLLHALDLEPPPVHPRRGDHDVGAHLGRRWRASSRGPRPSSSGCRDAAQHQELRAEALRLPAGEPRQLGAADAVREAEEVLDQRRVRGLAARARRARPRASTARPRRRRRRPRGRPARRRR